MTMLIGTRRALLGGALLPFNFDASKAAFVPGMAKRSGPGPFAAAPIVQGDYNTAGADSDEITCPRGPLIGGTAFYANADGYQGSIVFWWTPEFSSAQLTLTYAVLVSPKDSDLEVWYQYNSNQFRFAAASGNAFTIPAVVTAGTTYCIVASWDGKNPIDGTNYLRFSIQNAHTFGVTSSFAAAAPGIMGLGCRAGGDYAAQGIIEGLTIYRRPLFDGAWGVDVGNGDEINLVWAAGAGVRPQEVTGGDDVVAYLPTDGSTGQLVTGVGEMCNFPWSANELTNWHLQDDTAGSPDNWTAINAPVLADAEAANILFGTRAQKITVDAANEGFYQDFSVSAGEDFKVWVYTKSDGANIAQVRIYDQIGAANIVTISTTANSWQKLEACFEVPAGCTTVRVFVESGSAASYSFYAQQVQVLPDLWDDPGMETGTAPTNVGTPTTSAQSAEQAHSATNSWKVITDAIDEGIRRAITTTAGKFYLVETWVYPVSDTVDLTAFGITVASSGTGAWEKLSLVGHATGASSNVDVVSNAAVMTFYVDDVLVKECADISITVTPASEANSEETSGLRVDGYDDCDQPVVRLRANWGDIRFKVTQRHNPADVLKFGQTESYIFDLYEDANNYLRLYWSAANTLTIAYNAQGAGVVTGTHNAAAETWVATEKSIQVKYGGGGARLYINGALVATAAGAVAFASAPSVDINWLHRQDGMRQLDATIAAP